MRQNDEPAFPIGPVPATALGDQEADPTKQLWATGMTLRDWFAATIIGAMVADPNGKTPKFEQLAALAYNAADAMLAERAK